MNLTKIAIIIPDFDAGGEEKRAVFFANNYVRYFEKVILFAPDGTSSALLDNRVEHVKIDVKSIKNLPKILKIIKDNQVTILQGHKRFTMPYLLLAEKVLKVTSVFNFDNIYLKFNYACKLLSPSYIIYLSSIVEDYYKSLYKGFKNKTINIGGDFYQRFDKEKILALRNELGIDDNKFVILSLGRLSEQKNHKKLIYSLTALKDTNFICLIAGSGPLRSELEQLVLENGLVEKVIFLGHRTDVENLVNIADVLVQTSIFEGFPNVFIEAASVGLPIISTDVGSSKSIVRENGILVDPHSSDGISDAIKLMIQNYPQYKENAVAFVDSSYFRQFHKNIMLSNYIDFYKSL
ncbi:glycosyl transferase family 1 [Mucilaginibacter oryzae]|uniref:Glycosyl transferase family 1 n=1 Tax=Mucilaginibacter oryzae TaxID=468058 RepID=A0A316H987_9SPHI|nr:glycosyltransferase [Mucilaginibacter oryzae]PWK77729.1 glycosyl transferase family 1 [Mucilaginibacter oryzae]